MVLLAGIEFRHLRRESSTRRFLRIHGNEETAHEALLRTMDSQAGEGWSVTSKTRLVEVAGGRIDPNRLWSRPGAEKSYRANNPAWSGAELKKALDWLDRERPKALETILPPAGGLMVALHNNGPGYSVETERPISQAVSLPRKAEPHEFFLATARSDYEIIAAGPYNVVLQSEAGGEDDGSLSRLCARRGIRYVNLEVSHGKLEKQVEMLKWLLQALP
ncbi:MAG: hypothetical protein HY821_01360 [Acidobacteria bacterium]|nr:hypothetical protein [Acidobacteriota bacterium]